MKPEINQVYVGDGDGHFPYHHRTLVEDAIKRLAQRNTFGIIEREILRKPFPFSCSTCDVQM